MELLNEWYNSPRITGEAPDCSMPMSFDTYSNCSFGCIYCFSNYQRGCGLSADNYNAKKAKPASLKRIKFYFTELDNPKNPFRDIIKNKITMQVGGLSDPFDGFEEKYGHGYEILKYLKDIGYPLNFSSKGDLILRNPKYLDLFRGMEKLWSYKASIITLDAEKSKIIEPGTPSPQQRAKVLETLGKMGIWTIWRMRPFIIGLTSLDYEAQLKLAHDIGVKAISTEFFCLELRSMGIAKDKYDLLSKVVGFDIVQFYKNISSTQGYLRLNRKIKEPYYKRMKELCDEYGINLHVSDAHGKEYSASGSCCGLPADANGKPCLTKYSEFQFTNALNIAKRKGEVTWDDISKEDVWAKNLQVLKAPGFNSGNNTRREQKCGVDFNTYLRNLWNNPKAGGSPYKYFQGIMYPDRLDENQNIIYKYKSYENLHPNDGQK
jgi:DNA repair photolyase